MNIPNRVHFGLGFGFKYQYLLSVLLHALITGNRLILDNNKYESCKKYMIKKISDDNIHANVNYFMEQIVKIFPDIEKLNYNNDSLLLIEGEDGCFEDINLFTTNNNQSKVHLIQVKGSDSEASTSNLNKAIKKTLISMLQNDNTNISFQLLILINEEVTNWYYLRNDDDKIKMINTILEGYVFKIDTTSFLKTKMLKVFNEYLEELYIFGPTEDLYMFFSKKSTPTQYEKIKIILDSNSRLINTLFKLKLIVDNTSIIYKLDHRLIYLFLKYHYGNDKLTKILWNFEMKSMSGTDLDINWVKEQLHKINFDQSLVDELKFSKSTSNNTFKKGKIL